MDDITLVSEAQRGNLDAFNTLVLTYQDMAYNVAYRMVSDGDTAADVTQKAFLSAFRSLKTFRGGSFKSWLLRMVTNACLDELRRHKRHPSIPLEPLSDEDEEIESPAWMADDGPSPEDLAVRGELDRAIQSCLEGLPEDFRAVAVMVDIEGLDYQDVSGAIGKPLGTVKSRLARARLRLRDCLRHFWELLPAGIRLDDMRID